MSDSGFDDSLRVVAVQERRLTQCRSLIDFLARSWREGARGAFAMGARHGLVCVGCCWALMALLFVAGVMNLMWVAAIAALVMIEKLTRWGPVAGRCAGALLIGWGVWVALAAHR